MKNWGVILVALAGMIIGLSAALAETITGAAAASGSHVAAYQRRRGSHLRSDPRRPKFWDGKPRLGRKYGNRNRPSCNVCSRSHVRHS